MSVTTQPAKQPIPAYAETPIPARAGVGLKAQHYRTILADEPDLPLDFGSGIDHGRLMFGNIGVPERLTFSVIGPTVNQVARIEKYTKDMGVLALATPVIANTAPDLRLSLLPI